VKIADSAGGENYVVPVSSGALRAPHVKRIGAAFPLFVKFEDMVTAADGTEGLVYGGAPVTDRDLATDMGIPRKTIAEWRRHLARVGYITSKQTPVGNIIRVRKSKKLLWLQSSKSAQRGAPKSQSGVTEFQPPCPKSQPGAPFFGNPNKTRSQDSIKTVVALPLKEAWKVLGLSSSIGHLQFQSDWETWWLEHGRSAENSEKSSNNAKRVSTGVSTEASTDVGTTGNSIENSIVIDVMESFIQYRQRRGQKVPRPFFEAKRRLESSQSSTQGPVGIPEVPLPAIAADEAPAWRHDEVPA
jgi:hypothetical protein